MTRGPDPSQFLRPHPSTMRLLTCFLLALSTAAVPAATTFTETFIVNGLVPDNNDIGLADYGVVSAPGLTETTNVSVGLNFSGGWNGDLYVHLVHGSGFAVLLNRPGRTAGNPDGAGSSGMTILLDDSAPLDIHTDIASLGLATGTFQPDARTEDPLFVFDSSPRTAFLSSFNGLDPNGTWTIFVADQGPGLQSTLQSWSLTITAIPEPATALLGALATAWLVFRRTRFIRY